MAQQSDIVAIGFHSRVSDAALLDLLDTHNAKPTRAYIFASGFSGSHSSRNAAAGHVANEVFIQRVREETIDFFEKSLKGNTHRLQNLVQAHPGEELIQDEKLNSDLRSLLRLRGQFESVLHDAKSGNPIVYAVQIKLPAADLQKMRAHPLVRVTVSNDSVQSRSQIVQSLKPSGLENEYVRDDDLLGDFRAS